MSERDDRIARARAVRVIDELERRGVKLRRSGAELVGPCPACGGTDRFGVNLRKNVWLCRKAGAGGDAIALVQYLDSVDFLTAVEMLAGPAEERSEPPRASRNTGTRPPRDQVAAENAYRSREIARAREIWDAALNRRVAEKYLAWRGLAIPMGAKIRGIEQVPYYATLDGEARPVPIYEGPAMVAGIADTAGTFIGCHITWVDPRVLIDGFSGRSNGKAQIVHPDTGEILPAKKVRGSARGGHIPLGGPRDPARLVIGEGIETTLTVENALDDAMRAEMPTAFWAAVSLQNIGGRALASIRHPHLKRVDRLGRARAQLVPGPYPLIVPGEAALMPPDSAIDVITLGDGDSDPYTTRLVHARAAARWARPGRIVRTAWAPQGADFNDILLAAEQDGEPRHVRARAGLRLGTTGEGMAP